MKAHLIYHDDWITFERINTIALNANKEMLRLGVEDSMGFSYTLNIELGDNNSINFPVKGNMPEEIKRLKNALPTKANE